MKQLFLIVALALSINAYAQDDKTVTLVVSGQGKTQDEAKQNALRSAIEQAFGTFISSKTEILNDKLVKDEIVSITNGNIQKYELLSEGFIPDGNYSVTLRAIVSISKLSNFCESKGIEILFNGDLLSSNIQLIEMNKDAELISMKNLIKSSKDWLKKCFDYSLKTSEPTSLNGRYQISLTVSTSLNSNFVEYNKYTINTLKNISMSESEIKNYNKLEIEYYQIQILDLNKVPNTYYFRNEQSLNVFFNLFEKPEVYLQNFEVSNNLESIKGIKFQKVVRTDDRSALQKEWHSSSIVVKYNFFDNLKICHRRTGDGETEYIACFSQRGILYPGNLQHRFPIMIILNEGNNNNIRRNLLISFFCPLDQGLVSVRKFDYSFDKEKIKNISRFKVLPNKI
tara:strand:+ start:2257 stop:3447 length:1191 start_codon:yes stop_codon:yes gene_type:complete